MKAHSFVRENAPRVLHADKTIDDGLNFSRYLYFLFAPTLIYKDEYPRLVHIMNIIFTITTNQYNVFQSLWV